MSLSVWLLSVAVATANVEPLDGIWRFELDPADRGVGEQWHARTLTRTVRLPGSLPAQGIGDPITLDTPWHGGINDRSYFTAPEYERYRRPGNIKVPFWLQPEVYYVGPAWYQRDVIIPDSWRGRRTVLYLERPHWETRVWLNNRFVGTHDSLSVPHEYDLGILEPGRYQLTIRVDNRWIIDIGHNSHSVSDHTQGNWNGVVGRIELHSTPPVWLDDVQVYPNVSARAARVWIRVGNATGRPGTGSVQVAGQAIPVAWTEHGVTTEVTVTVAAALWDEFRPNLTELMVRLGDDERRVRFGLREFSTQGTQFTINGQPTFIRGTLDCAAYPRTGHPPMTVEEWKKVIATAKSYGLNLFRFHSWCPPEAAFQAADELGFYFHVEASTWPNGSTTIGDGKPVDEWAWRETERILRKYGNHPSFVLMACGNEPGGSRQREYLARWVSHFKTADPRRLFTSGAGWPELAENQWHCTPRPRIHQWGAGTKSRINALPPETVTDYRDFIRARTVPVVSHEIGQWCVYPNLAETNKYTGYLKARNFEIFRDRLEENGLLDLAPAFLHASGRLQVLCYKEEIESALRTPGMGGFELLSLSDFPGQGTALVGVLDAFWEEKGYVTAEEFRRFCGPTVPLARLGKRVFTVNDTLEATLEVAHFGPEPLDPHAAAWRIVSDSGVEIARGSGLGAIRVPLTNAPAPSRCRLVVRVGHAENDWDIWVYPAAEDPPVPSSVRVVQVTGDLDPSVFRSKERLVLLLDPKRVKKGRPPVELGFSSIFWNTSWTRRQPPTTLGILCDPRHPLFAAFPTDAHSNWQWWYLIVRAAPMLLTDLPRDVQPLVRVIDDWFTARPLGLVLEVRVENTPTLVCSIALDADDPVTRQFRRSLLDYVASPQFAPRVQVSAEVLRSLLAVSAPTVRADSEARGYEAAHAVDGDPSTIWHTPWQGTVPGFPHWLELRWPEPIRIGSVRLVPRQDMPNGRFRDFEIYVNPSGTHHGTRVARGQMYSDARPVWVAVSPPVTADTLRVVMRTSWANQPFAALAEIAVGPESPTNEAPPPRVILTPPAPKEPRIHGPKVYGVRPGSPFLFRIPCTGVRPITFEASGLPEGLALDAARGVITGRTSRTGTHMVTLRAHNAHGEARRELRIVVGDRIALTPPMGWNHWYAHYDRVTDALVRQAVDIMSTNGMADVGYQYVCIDDCWMNAPATGRHQSDPQRVGPARDEQGRLRPNVHFPDMKALTDYIHAHGLKAGIYSSPGPNTCAGFYGSFGHEEIDARTFAEWGFDLLKYDWCSYGRAAGVDFRTAPLGEVQKPYRIMGELLRRQPRDILFNLCQYGRREVWRWGAEVGGHSWRTGGDLGYELHRIFEVALNNFALREFNRPGAWNDPDYIQIGWIAHPNDRFALQPAPLTPNECHAFMSLWCLMAAPLFYSGDLARLDEFTLSILCNPELIEINQDPLGECGEVLGVPAETFVVVKRMEDGSRAIGLCNRDFQPRRIAVRWADLGLSGRQRVRDAWRGRDLGVFAEGYEAVVPERFVEVLRMWPDSTP